MRALAPCFRFLVPALCGSVLVALAGCSSVQISDRQQYEGARLPRPDRIIVYDFAATPYDLPPWSDAASAYAAPDASPSDQELEAGRKLGAEVAEELVKRIQEMGLPGVEAEGQPDPQDGDIAIVGYFLSMDKGSAVKRIALGFGAGAAEVSTRVEGYLATEEGMRKLGAGTASTTANKTPGLIVPLAVTVATANPIGLAVGGALKVATAASGRDTIRGEAKRVADKIADTLQVKFSEQGWIDGS